jgi:uncharacterized protein (TIGR03000 family)
MKSFISFSVFGLVACVLWDGDAAGRGFGGFHGGGGFSRSYGGRSYSGARSFSGYSGWDRGGAGGAYEHSYSGAHGGSISTEGTRGAAYGPRGAVAGGSRETTVTGPEGRSYTGSSERAAAVGPRGRFVGGSEHAGTATGPGGTVSRGWESAYAGRRFPSDFGLAHYSAVGAAGAAHGTAYWSHGYCATRAGYVRSGFGYYNCFHAGWYAAHPGCWYPAAWAGAAAWRAATWATAAAFCGIASTGGGGYDIAPVDYDYGNNVVYQDSNVYEDGQQIATADQYAQQATSLAEQGQKAEAPDAAEWKALGVFALAQGEEKTSNSVFQLAINKEGVIRGNYYDGLMDSTTPVYGSVDRNSQRAAWTIGKKNERVFEAGLYNLTKEETPVLVHFGKDKTQQWLLVRVEQPDKDGKAPVVAKDTPAPATEDGVARVTVIVPADARVFLDDSPTMQTGTERTFVSPTLQAGARYTYSIRASWTEGGRTVEQTRDVPVRAGANVRVDFTNSQP